MQHWSTYIYLHIHSFTIYKICHSAPPAFHSPMPFPSTDTNIHTGAHVFWKSHHNMRQREKASFFLGDGPMKNTLLGGLVDIFANNTVISSWWAKHANVCLLIAHKRTAHSFALIHKLRQTLPLLCRLLSFSLFYFPPSSLSPGRAHSYSHPGTSLEVCRPHTEQCKDLSLTLSFPPFFPLSFPFLYFHSFSIILSSSSSPLFPHLTCSKPSLTELV